MARIQNSSKLYALYDNDTFEFIQCGGKIGWVTKAGAKAAYRLKKDTGYYGENCGMNFDQLAEKYNVCIVEIRSDGEMVFDN